MGNRGVPHQNRFTPFGTCCGRHPYGSRQQALQTTPSRPVCSLFVVILRHDGMTAFNSTITFNAEQPASAPQLEPAFEHPLRNRTTHESVINTLRVNAITDRDTFVNMFDSETALKEGASDLGFDLTSGELPHKREFASCD